jgi:hypothetical protein
VPAAGTSPQSKASALLPSWGTLERILKRTLPVVDRYAIPVVLLRNNVWWSDIVALCVKNFGL